MTPSDLRLSVTDSVVVVVDIQDKLLAKMPTAEGLLRNAGFILDVANLLGVPVVATEQYPKGLGPTAPAIASRLTLPCLAKTAFSCCDAEGFLPTLTEFQRPVAVVLGMETHVCVLQTALGLLEAGYRVHLPEDALAARGSLDHNLALRQLARVGAVVTTCETIAFQWLRDATHPHFKAVSKLIIERSTL